MERSCSLPWCVLMELPYWLLREKWMLVVRREIHYCRKLEEYHTLIMSRRRALQNWTHLYRIIHPANEISQQSGNATVCEHKILIANQHQLHITHSLTYVSSRNCRVGCHYCRIRCLEDFMYNIPWPGGNQLVGAQSWDWDGLYCCVDLAWSGSGGVWGECSCSGAVELPKNYR